MIFNNKIDIIIVSCSLRREQHPQACREEKTTKTQEEDHKGISKTILNAIADCRIGFCRSPILYTSRRLYPHWNKEIYNQVYNKTNCTEMKWVELKTSNSILPRSSHGVSVVHLEGKNMLVVYGGENIARTPLDSKINTLNIDENREELSWVEAKPSSGENIPEPRVAHARTSIGTKVYIFGGRQSITMDEAPLNDLYSFDLATKIWENISVPSSGSVPSPRSFHKMVSVGKKLYIFGGCGAGGRMADLHCYDVETKSWTALSTGNIEIPGRGGAGFMPSSDGKYLFIVGGFAGKEMNDVYRYDIEAQTMSKIYEQDDDQETNPLRPFSVSCGGVLHGLIHYFGGEVNPSQKGP